MSRATHNWLSGWQWWVLGAYMLIGLLVELWQWKIMGGRVSYKDLVADLLGTIGGILLYV